MKKLVFLVLLFVIFSCKENHQKKNEKDRREWILNGVWNIVETEKPFRQFQNGLKFSEDNQVFFIDSQGHTIPPHSWQIFEIKGDTLWIVDYKYDVTVRQNKGTFVFLIESLDSKKMVLKLLHPLPGNQIILKNEKTK